MGHWGPRPFDNDNARDWLDGLAAKPNAGAVSRAFTSATRPKADDDNQRVAVAAAALVAAARLWKFPAAVDDVVRGWLAGIPEARLKEWSTTALPVVRSIRKKSLLRQLWAESSRLAKWEAEIDVIAANLKAPLAPRLKKPARAAVAKKSSTHQWSPGDVFRLALTNGEFAWGRLYEPNQFGIYRHFSRDPDSAPIGSRDFFHFFRFYRDQYKKRDLVFVGRDPFAPGEQDWQPMYGLQFPSFQWIRPSNRQEHHFSASEYRVAPTDEVACLSKNCYHSVKSVVEILSGRHQPDQYLRLCPHLPNAEGVLHYQPWSAWPAIRQRFLRKYGPDFEAIFRDRMLRPGPVRFD